MRGGVVIVLLGLTALGAYSIGRQTATTNAPSSTAPSNTYAKPLALTEALPSAPQQVSTSSSATSPGVAKPPPAKPTPTTSAPQKLDNREKVEVALTAAAIAAIMIKASRDQYHATGRPCACPDDAMRNGRACGGKSAYTRPGGAAPLCYPTDVTAAMIDAYRQRAASR